jgi:hypothetical protein
LDEVLAAIPLKVGREETDALIEPIPTPEVGSVGVEYNLVRSSLLHAHSEVGVAVL